ncbi:MAG: hypothetical protein KatS3mg115_1041 [Candidatus Poribacteria bacterium]|nr:MAG: hypothetical protein KatS3mg115_1041 [Candidatus Poribacteria bacterium]
MWRRLIATTAFLGLALAAWGEASPEVGTIQGVLINPWLTRGGSFVVYVERASEGPYPMPEQAPVLDQIKMEFVPHLLPVVTGWEVEIRNSDQVFHNVHAYLGRETLFNLATPPNFQPIRRTIERPGIITILCDVHPEMSAYILSLQNPYFVVVPDPKMVERMGPPKSPRVPFVIKNVPPGEYALRVWSEKLKKPQLEKRFPVTVEAGKTAQVTINP